MAKSLKLKDGTKAGIELAINDTPIKDDWDLLCAISAAGNELKEAAGITYRNRAVTENKQMYKAIDAIISNLRELADNYQLSQITQEGGKNGNNSNS